MRQALNDESMTVATRLDGLNPQQREAAQHFEGPILVLAGAGSGKTRVLTTRIAHLVEEHGVDPASILAVTFTNKAAAEMRERVRRLLGAEPAGMWIGTFHSIGARLLRRHAAQLGWASNFSIFDADQSLREVKRAMERQRVSTKDWHPKTVRSTISSAKNALVPAAEYEKLPGRYNEIIARVYPDYEEALEAQNALDFDDLLVKPVELFEAHPPVLQRYRERFRFVLVDEYQDTNHAQYRLLNLLAAEHRNLMVVGDDDQSIYGWRGADIRNILDFENDFPATRVVRLEQNYRSTGRILTAANHVIAANAKRKGKTLRTDAGLGEPVTRVEAADERDEADWIAAEIQISMVRDPELRPRDFVVLYRTNAQSRALEETFRRRDLPYQIVAGTRFYERREIMDVLAYLRLISNPKDAGAFDRIVNTPRRGIGDVTKARLLEWTSIRGLTPVAAAARARECEGLRGGVVDSLVGFATLITSYQRLARETGVAELLEDLIEETGLLEALNEEGPEGRERIDNVRELVAGAHEFDHAETQSRGAAEGDVADAYTTDDVAGPHTADDRLGDPREPGADAEQEGATPLDLFLQKISLITDVDRHDAQADATALMTLHNAKGLEFPIVFISGVENGLLPLNRTVDEPHELEEERRLFYVGITRAERKLYMTHVRSRRRAGTTERAMASFFLEPLDAAAVEKVTTPKAKAWTADAWTDRGRDRASAVGSLGFRGADDAGFDVDWAAPVDAWDTPRFVKGERVRHPRFGSGVIRELSGFGDGLRAVIEFETNGRRKLAVRHANLSKEL